MVGKGGDMARISIGEFRKRDNRRVRTRTLAEERLLGRGYREKLRKAEREDRIAGRDPFSEDSSEGKLRAELARKIKLQMKHQKQKKLDDANPIFSDKKKKVAKKGRKKKPRLGMYDR